jgi:hypothetical protein
MRIASAQVQMVGAHQSTVRRETRESLTVVQGAAQAPAPASTPAPVTTSAPPGDAVALSGAPEARLVAATRALRSGALRPASNGGRVGTASASGETGPGASMAPRFAFTRGPLAPRESAQTGATAITGKPAKGGDAGEGGSLKNEDMKTAIMRQLFERMTGKKMDESEFERVMKELEAGRGEFRLSTPGSEAAGLAGDVEMPGPVAGLRFESFERIEERETTAFSARAVITTEDGQEIEVGVDMVLSREFVEERSLEVVFGQAGAAGAAGAAGPNGGEQAKVKDPLVINIDAPAAALREDTTAFDLDSDGQADDIHFVAPGSGFVALDKNGNGRIDDGSELFGATTGDGFEELAAYDDDGNGWIDEDDAVFDQLEVWSKDAAGNDQRAGLAEHNVGAIYLGRVAAPHSYRNRDNENVAQMRTAGFYVGEIGHRAGSMQQLDLVV